MSDRLTAWVRTVVPALWATLVAWLVSLGLPPAVTGAAAGLVDVLVVPGALASVYALLRWLEPRTPDWLTRVLLGSARPPIY
jgi:4-amino-4-deoxy-L-arabinose transferase-like glycosyltransferase